MSRFSQQIEINGKKIGDDRVYIIAEMACAHDGEFEKAKKLVDSAVDAGADAIQFELLEPDENVVPGKEINLLLHKLYLSHQEWSDLFDYGREKKLDIFAFSYDLPALELAIKLKADAIKLNSSDLMNIDMLELCAKSGIPTTIGTGGSTFEEISEALECFRQNGGKDVVLMQGVQSFPTLIEYARISRMNALKATFGTLVGYADHTDPETEIAHYIDLVALGMGAKVIEKHITLDRKEKGIDYQSALEPAELKKFVSTIREAEKALGWSNLQPLIEPDQKYRLFQKKCIVAGKDLQTGEVIYRDNVKFLRDTENPGIAPLHINKVIGKKIKNEIPKYKLIDLIDLED